jgi:excinuclease ABC subunit C
VPRRVLVPCEPEEADLLEAWLATLRGGPVDLAVPKRGEKRALQEMVTRNAGEDLARHRLRRASDHNTRSRALTELQVALGLRQAPLRIECYDMSHLQGTDYVGSMVVFEDGLPKKSDYRKFKVRGVGGNDDYAAMEEVLTRRLGALVEERAAKAGEQEPGKRQRRRFAYPPNLLLLDGGKGQLGVGERVVASLGLEGEIDLAALAKQFEEVYRPGEDQPVRITRGSEALYLLQRVRDEAHRFAITYHRQRRGTRMTASVLDGVPGLGPVRRARLVRELGGMRSLRSASAEDLRELPWLPDRVADAVHSRLHGPGEGRLGGA